MCKVRVIAESLVVCFLGREPYGGRAYMELSYSPRYLHLTCYPYSSLFKTQRIFRRSVIDLSVGIERAKIQRSGGIHKFINSRLRCPPRTGPFQSHVDIPSTSSHPAYPGLITVVQRRRFTFQRRRFHLPAHSGHSVEAYTAPSKGSNKCKQPLTPVTGWSQLLPRIEFNKSKARGQSPITEFTHLEAQESD